MLFSISDSETSVELKYWTNMETSSQDRSPLMALFPRKLGVEMPSDNQELRIKSSIAELRLKLIHNLNEPYWQKGKSDITSVQSLCIQIVKLNWLHLVTFVFACVDYPRLLIENEEVSF